VTWLEFAVIAVAIVAASCLQASIGFGMGMLAAPVIALIDPALLPASIIMLAFIVTLIVTIREREHLDLKGAGWGLAGRIPGSVFGAWLVVSLPASGLAWLVAIVVLVGALLACLGWAPIPGRRNLVVAGLASGVMGTATSIGGAPMALIWRRSEGARLRGTMSAFFLVSSVVSLAALFVAGALNFSAVRLVLWMLPAMLVGYLLSRVVGRHLDRRGLSIAALLASTFGALLLIGRQIIG
jgi:uncharacterized membrane protein YfcA